MKRKYWPKRNETIGPNETKLLAQTKRNYWSKRNETIGPNETKLLAQTLAALKRHLPRG